MYIYSTIGSILPSIESLDVLGIPYNTNGNFITIYLDRNKYTIIPNNKGNNSLSYFIIDTYTYRIVASGNLEINNNYQYYCQGELRVFSSYDLTTYDYYRENCDGYDDASFYNERLLRETNKAKVNKKIYFYNYIFFFIL